MTDEELDRARADKAFGLSMSCTHSAAQLAARLAREGWTPLDELEAEIKALIPSYIAGKSLAEAQSRYEQMPTIIRKALERGIEIGKLMERTK